MRFAQHFHRCEFVVVWASVGMLLELLGVAIQAAEVDYLTQVKPILQKHCYACHGALRQRGGLRLDTVALANRGGRAVRLLWVATCRRVSPTRRSPARLGLRCHPREKESH